MATQLLTAAGANYYMDVCLNTDRMLAYFDTSAHDVQTLREIYGRNARAGIRRVGRRSRHLSARRRRQRHSRAAMGNPEQFCETDAEFRELMGRTPALYGLENAGPRPANAVTRRTRINQAVARTAIQAELESRPIAKDCLISACSRPRPPKRRPISTLRRPAHDCRPRAVCSSRRNGGRCRSSSRTA